MGLCYSKRQSRSVYIPSIIYIELIDESDMSIDSDYCEFTIKNLSIL